MRCKFLKPTKQAQNTVSYLYDKFIRSQKEDDGKIELLTHNLDNKTKDEWIETTKNNTQVQAESKKQGRTPKWQSNVMHIVLSLHPDDKDKIDFTKMLHELCQELKIDPATNNLISWKHKDQEHHHMHLLFSQVDYKGERWKEVSHIGRKLNEFALKQTKTHSLTYEVKQETDKKRVTPIKKELEKELYKIKSNVNNFQEFLEKINNHIDISVTINEEGCLIYSYNKNDEENTYSFHENSLKKSYSFKNLEQFDTNKEREDSISEQKAFIQTRIAAALNKSTSLDDLQTELLKNNIKLIVNKSKTGHVFGYSFCSTNQKEATTFTATQLGFSKSKIDFRLKSNAAKTEFNSTLINQKDELQSFGKKIELENMDHSIWNSYGNFSQENDDAINEEDRRRRRRKKRNR